MRLIQAVIALLLLFQWPTGLQAQQDSEQPQQGTAREECSFDMEMRFFAVNDFDDSALDKAAVKQAIRKAVVQACAEDNILEPANLNEYDSFSIVTGSQPSRAVVWPCDAFNSDDKTCYNVIPENSFVFELSPFNGYSPKVDDLLFALRCGFAPETVEEEDETACLVD
ncbi:MAG: hypothetical protein AAGH53_03260 [Pseudomonadota bacterium]